MENEDFKGGSGGGGHGRGGRGGGGEGEERQVFSFARDLREERGRGGEKESDCSK